MEVDIHRFSKWRRGVLTTIKALVLKDNYGCGSGGHPIKRFARSWPRASTNFRTLVKSIHIKKNHCKDNLVVRVKRDQYSKLGWLATFIESSTVNLEYSEVALKGQEVTS